MQRFATIPDIRVGPPSRKAEKGQSLVELVLITPLLVLILVAAGYAGMGLYQAQMASDAIRQPSMRKLDMAKEPGAINNGVLTTWVQGSELKGTVNIDSPVDSVSQVNADQYISVLVGTKNYAAGRPYIPTFTFTVAQVMNRNLLAAANAGGAFARGTNPWVPFGGPRPLPWNVISRDHLPLSFELENNCAGTNLPPNRQDALSQFILPGQNYISRTRIDVNSPATEGTIMQIAATYPEDCTTAESANWQAECQAEKDALSPRPMPPNINGAPPGTVTARYVFRNPPGGPGMQMTYNVTCTGPNNCQADNNPSYEPIPGFSAENGMYYDDSGNYAGPPTNFVESCMASKQSVCQLDKARLRAQQIINGFPEECSIEPVN